MTELSDQPGESTMVIDVTGLPIDGTPLVEIREEDLRLVTRARQGQTVSLVPGRYVVRLVRPDGSEEIQIEHVLPDMTHHVLVVGAPPNLAREAVGSAALRALSSSAEPEDVEAWRDVAEPDMWFMRVVSGATGEPLQIPTPDSEFLITDRAGAWRAVAITLRVTGESAAGVLFAQIARHGMVPLNVALPATGSSGIESAHMRVDLEGQRGALRVAAAPGLDDPATEALAAYFAGGLFREAAEIAAGSGEWTSPIGSVLGSLALLRAGSDAHIRSPVSVSDALPADALVVEAELALRSGDIGAARSLFDKAVEHGIPAFADAAALLARRLSDGFASDPPPEAVTNLRASTAHDELSTLMTTFRAADPSDLVRSQEPVTDFEGWFAFRGEELRQLAFT